VPRLELIWQEDATARVFTRDDDGSEAGERRIDAAELLRLADAPPEGLELGGSARTAFAIVELAHRGVAEGLVHPYLEHADGAWHAFWGATLDATVHKALSQIAAALPAVCAAPFDGDREAAVHDLYPVLVDRIARDRLLADRVRLTGRHGVGRATAAELFLAGLAAAESTLPPHSGYPALSRRVSGWIDAGLSRRSAAPWRLGLHLDERPGATPEAAHAIVLELWLQAEDDPTLGLPASLLWSGGHEVYSFLRAGDARRDLIRQLTEIAPLLADAGIELDPTEPSEAELEPETVRRFLRESVSRLEERGVPVTLPAAWLGTRSRLRVNLRATSGPRGRSSGFLSTDELARFDWRLAVGDDVLTDQELADLAAAKQPFVQIGGRWHALHRTDVERALRFLERRGQGHGLVDLVRAVSGLETAEAGLEVGAV
jgi:hypothetical protein